ncbi:hypothetical protein [Pukyongiella litopenaei]|uniref:Uncharacterized protein n=1 Tax=Pukyongiella litopenaei TaxID=2605946 RepID=A0A2S0MP78_9RHOB|nr:hypothetical protein [Pukyongiella litopenaei]AVO37561.1 hypothetical protein C6Y53_07500 [Pukyongiella litopenaei]
MSRNLRAAVAVALVATVGLAAADPLVSEGGLRLHSGFLPDGSFGFALELTEDFPAVGGRPGLPVGTFVLHVERQRDGSGKGGQGQAQMQALLSDIQPGDVVHLVVLFPDGTRDRVTVTQPSLADLAAEERGRRLEAELRLYEASRVAVTLKVLDVEISEVLTTVQAATSVRLGR